MHLCSFYVQTNHTQNIVILFEFLFFFNHFEVPSIAIKKISKMQLSESDRQKNFFQHIRKMLKWSILNKTLRLTLYLAHYFGEIACPTRKKIIILNVLYYLIWFDLRVVVQRKFIKFKMQKWILCWKHEKNKQTRRKTLKWQ